jgi:hypothetical protein
MGVTTLTGPFIPQYSEDTKFFMQLIWIHLPRNLDNQLLKKNIYEKTATFPFPKGIIQIDVDPYF